MFCPKCGTQNADDAKFCRACGTMLESNNQTNFNSDSPEQSQMANMNQQAMNQQVYQQQYYQQPNVPKMPKAPNQLMQKLKALPKNVCIGVGAAVVALIVIIIIAVNASNTINLNKYITITADGYDGYGRAYATIDWDAIEQKYGKKIKYTKAAKKALSSELGVLPKDWSENLLEFYPAIDYLYDAIGIDLSQSSKLSNGEEITYSWDIDEEIGTYVKCKFKYKEGKYKVSDLTKVGTFDPFADVVVSFDGTSPDGRVYIDYMGDKLSSYNFTANNSQGLKNGDVITVSLTGEDISYYAEAFGAVPDKTEKEYTVSGLAEYVLSYSDLPEDFIASAKADVEDKIYSYVAKYYNKNCTLTDLTYAGYVFLDRKNGSNAWVYNNYVVIYSGIVSDAELNFRPTKVYFPVEYSNILNTAGELTYDSSSNILGYSYFNNYYSTNGYIVPVVAYAEICESNRADYNIECGDGFENYGSYTPINNISDINTDCLNEMIDYAQDKIESYIASEYGDYVTVSGLQMVGEYLLTAKSQGNDFEKNNVVYIVFSAVAHSTKGKFDDMYVYFPVEFSGLVKLSTGESIILRTGEIKGYHSYPNTWSYTKGYLDGAEMYTDLVTANREKYTFEVSAGLAGFGN